MSLRPVQTVLEPSGPFAAVRSWIASREPGAVGIRHAAGSIPAFLLGDLARRGQAIWCVLPDSERAAYLHSDLQQVLRDETSVLFLPPTDHRPYDPDHVDDPAPVIQRADVFQRLADGWRGVLVTGADALLEKVPALENVKSATLTVAVAQSIAPEDLIGSLTDLGFDRVEFVEQPGEMALRGGILDVFPFVGDFPVRIEFFGDEIDSIREFDIHTQRSVSRRTSARLVPNLDSESAAEAGSRIALSGCLADDFLVALFDPESISGELQARFERITEAYEARLRADASVPAPDALYVPPREFEAAFADRRRFLFGTLGAHGGEQEIDFACRPQPSFNRAMAPLRRQLAVNARDGIQTTILCDSRGQENRLRELLEDVIEPLGVSLTVESLHEGFEAPDLGLAVYTDHQIFDRYHRPTARRQKQRFGGLSLRELHQLEPGDFVVHIDHGIGRFAGMDHIDVQGRQQEVVRLLYRADDVLYVNVGALHKLHKYKGKEGHQPQLTKLGSGQWERTKARTKKRVKDIARDLIQLYARRKQSDGYGFARDTVWQRELEASFAFEDTPDQASAAEAVKDDMEQPVPMDRLVCGDVGFGKTEIAVRAAFKAVQDGRQVAILVPTTVLASQHFRTFSARLERFPVRVEMLSRFRTGSDTRSVVDGLADGTVDVVIGTHRLISKDVTFRNLGLLIVDEEQRFGVGVKEKLRKLRVNVDTLTLTATPIPRTLQFSLLGARDLSIISTPPPNRQPIVTEIHTFDKDLVRDAILYEVNRGGQVFFIHNRIQSIHEIADMIRSLLPDVRIVVAHGQMKGPDLERAMLRFVDQKADVLVSTSIIENGLDIGNANTIIIDRAGHFGLSELHQLRGRVGRSDRKAFCYLLVPSIQGLTREAKQRLQAVEEFSELGSGFQIAMRDLDIRGAGNLLGAEQSGFIEDVGFETYHRILDEAVQELRSDEFSDLFDTHVTPRAGDTSVEIDEDALIPETYLANRVERLNLYRRLAEATTPADLETVSEEMVDRFGPLPGEVSSLLRATKLRMGARALRLTKVAYRNTRLFLHFPEPTGDSYFYESVFHPLLARLAGLDRRYVLKESKSGRLRAIVQDVPDAGVALDVLERLQEDPVEA